MSFENKVALVTGASRGIGKQIAHDLAEKGVYVYGTATTESGANKITESFATAGLKGMGLQLNVTDAESVTTVMKFMKDNAGSADILVNNAGITKDNIMLRMSDEQWDDVIATNLTAIFKISKLCLRHMMKKRWGRIISIGSVVASSGNPGQANYCAAKAGLIGFSKSLANEVASRSITVNIVAPGFVQTDMTDALTDEQKEGIMSVVPARRMGKPKEISAAVCFLAEENAGYVTGNTIHVNGGMYMA